MPATLAAMGAGLLAAAGRGGRVPVGAGAVSEERSTRRWRSAARPPAFGERTRGEVELHLGAWGDARWSCLFAEDTRLPRARGRSRGRRAAARGRARAASARRW